jgi:hypothetical protein
LVFSPGIKRDRGVALTTLKRIQEVPDQVLAKTDIDKDVLQVSILFEC